MTMYTPIITPLGFELSLLYINLIAAALGTAMWRIAGVFLARKLTAEHWIVKISTFTGYAILSGYMAVLLIYPNNPALSDVSTIGRVGALFVTAVTFYLSGKNMLVGLFSGIAFFTIFLYI